jgi:hypothetical protein
MAWAILKGLSAPALVSRAEIDATGKKITSSEACRISQLKSSDSGSLSFERLDDSLPMPVDSRAEPALKLAPVLADLDLYELRVTGLPAGKYTVKIDAEESETVTSDQLASGWNMANGPGPVQKQARELLKLVFEKNDLFFNRWRNVQLYGFPAWAEGPEVENARKKALAKLDEQIAEKESEIEKLRKPKVHQFEIKLAN